MDEQRINDLRALAAKQQHEGYWQEADANRKLADKMQWEWKWYTAQIARALEFAEPHYRERERERLTLLAKVQSNAPIGYTDWQQAQSGKLHTPTPEPSTLLNDSRHSDLTQKLNVWARQLQSAGLLTDGERRQLVLNCPEFPGDKEERLKAEAEHTRLVRARDYILSQATDRRAALAIYNRSEEPLSGAKLTKMVSKCVDEKLLPAEWRGGRQLGEVFSRILRGGQ